MNGFYLAVAAGGFAVGAVAFLIATVINADLAVARRGGDLAADREKKQ
jgi:hypothetical protein